MKSITIETLEDLKDLQAFENNQYVDLNQGEFKELSASLKEASVNTIRRLPKKKSIKKHF